MRETLKEIAGFKNEGRDPKEPGQAAAIRARETLDELKLFLQETQWDQRRKHQETQRSDLGGQAVIGLKEPVPH